MSRTRSFLFLQSVCSPFFARLAEKLRSNGHRVHKINFNVGDVVYCLGQPASNFRGEIRHLSEFLTSHIEKHAVTDQILFGDRRPVHRKAVECAKACAVRTHVFEEGYFRPYWVTLEREGVNAHSLLSRDPKWYLDIGRTLPDYGDGTPFQSSFAVRAFHDVVYHAAGFWNPLLFPRYCTHAPVNAAVEYLGYSKRLPMLRFHKRKDSAVIKALIDDGTPFFFLPLQLGSDAQILDHSKFPDMVSVLEHVMASFAKCARGNAMLLIKNHPLDTGKENYHEAIGRLANLFGIVGRVIYVETGDLETLLRNARGTVTVNSTVGALSLGLKCPTIALSSPIYDLPGLTFQGGLDEFWRTPTLPDAELFRCFRNTVIHTTQVNGGFYSREGIALAVENSSRILEAEHSRMEQLC